MIQYLLPGVDTMSLIEGHAGHFSVDGNVLTVELESGIYEEGTYTIVLPGFLIISAADGTQFGGLTSTFTVDGTLNGIGNVNAEDGKQVIYDVNGRRVKNAVKGVYIINGKKVLVK